MRARFTYLGLEGGGVRDMDVDFLLQDTGVIREEIDPVQEVGTAAAGRGRLGFGDDLVDLQGFGQEFGPRATVETASPGPTAVSLVLRGDAL